jgi:hypothetical protein
MFKDELANVHKKQGGLPAICSEWYLVQSIDQKISERQLDQGDADCWYNWKLTD